MLHTANSPYKKDKDRTKGKGRRICLRGGGGEFIQFLVALAILPRTIFKNRIHSSFSFKSSWCANHPIPKDKTILKIRMNSSFSFKSSWCAIHPIIQMVWSSVFILLLCSLILKRLANKVGWFTSNLIDCKKSETDLCQSKM